MRLFDFFTEYKQLRRNMMKSRSYLFDRSSWLCMRERFALTALSLASSLSLSSECQCINNKSYSKYLTKTQIHS